MKLANTIVGSTGNDTLAGGSGGDILTGGGGANVFSLLALSDSSVADSGRDRITDFSTVNGDTIDLHLLDANTSVIGDQAFSFIGTAGFSGIAGQLSYAAAGTDTQIMGDIDGDRVADFSILLIGSRTLGASNFNL